MKKSACFIGNGKVDLILKEKIQDIIKNLVEDGTEIFMFGSKSEFRDVCFDIVTQFKVSNNNIKTVGCPCNGELFYLQKDKYTQEMTIYNTLNKKINVQGFDEINQFNNEGLSYFDRNKNMIESSDFCVFYFKKEEHILPSKYKTRLTKLQSVNEENLVLDYAKKLNKQIISIN